MKGLIYALMIAVIVPHGAVSQARSDHVYVEHLYGWSVSYPDNWTIDTLDPGFVQIHQPPTLPYGLVGIHSARALKGASLGDFADRMMANEADMAGFKVLSRRSTTLSDGTPALEIDDVIGTDLVGESRKLVVLRGDRGLVVDAETYRDSFPALAPYFEKILRSFGLVAPTTHALILGVPFIGWGDAARLDYHDKNILNPSVPASLGMILEYWGLDRHLVEHSLDAPQGWTSASSEGGTLDSVRSYVARGIPIMVMLAMTPAAHQAEPTAAAMASLIGSGEISPGSNLTQSQLQHVQDLTSTNAGFGSGILGKMVSADTLRHWGDVLGQPIWQETVFEPARVAIGFDDDRQVVILHDPSFGPAWEVSYNDFEAMWRLYDHNVTALFPVDLTRRSAGHSGAAPYAPRTPSQHAAESFVFGYALASVGHLVEAKARLNAGLNAADVPLGYRHLFFLELGRVAQASGDTALAVSDYEQARKLIPQHHRPWLFLSQLYEHSGRPEWRAESGKLRKRAEGLCRDTEARAAVRRSLPHDFTMMGCEGLLPL
jgi:hypothetical protein